MLFQIQNHERWILKIALPQIGESRDRRTVQDPEGNRKPMTNLTWEMSINSRLLYKQRRQNAPTPYPYVQYHEFQLPVIGRPTNLHNVGRFHVPRVVETWQNL